MRPTCMRTTLAVTMVLAALVPVAGAAPAHALSCVGPDDAIADADQVFAGRIADAAQGTVLIEVDEIWKGGPVERRVWLRVDLPEWSAWAGPDGGVPDGYSSPEQWAFAPSNRSVNPCSSWRVSDVREHAPDRPLPPVADGTLDHEREAPAPKEQNDGRLVAAAAGGLGGGGVAAAVVLLLLRRRSPLRRSRRPLRR